MDNTLKKYTYPRYTSPFSVLKTINMIMTYTHYTLVSTCLMACICCFAQHSSEIRGLLSIKCPREMLWDLLYFM